MVLHVCQFPLGTFDVVLNDPEPININPPDAVLFPFFEQDAVTFAPLNVIKTTRHINNYFDGQTRMLRDTSFVINISSIVDFCLHGRTFQKYRIVMEKLIKHCMQIINNTELHYNAFFDNLNSLQYEHSLENKTDVLEIHKSMMYRETLNQTIVEYVSDRNIIAFQIHTPRTTLMLHEPTFYFIDMDRFLILNTSQVLGNLVKTTPALNTCTMFIPFGLYFEDLCIKTCVDALKQHNWYGFNMMFNNRLNTWAFDTNMSLLIFDDFMFKRFFKRGSSTMFKFVSDITDINDITFPLKQHVVIKYSVLKSMYFKFMTIHDNKWIHLLHGNNEMTWRAYQNGQLNIDSPLMVSIFQVNWKRIITNIESHHVYFEIFKNFSVDIIWALTHDLSDVHQLVQSFYDPRGLCFYDFMKNYDTLVKLIDIQVPTVSSFMEIHIQKSLKETLGVNDMYFGTTVKDYIAHVSDNTNFIKNLTEDALMASQCPVCMSPIKDMSSVIGGSCGHLICTSCFTHTLDGTQRCCVCRTEMKRIMNICFRAQQSSDLHDLKSMHGTKKGFVLWILKMIASAKSTVVVIIDNDFFTMFLHPNLRMFLTQSKFDFLNRINIYYNQRFKNEAFKTIHRVASNKSNVFFITYDNAFALSTYLFDSSRFRHLHIDSVFVFSPPYLNTGFLRKNPEQINKFSSKFIYNIQTYLGHDTPVSLVSLV